MAALTTSAIFGPSLRRSQRTRRSSAVSASASRRGGVVYVAASDKVRQDPSTLAVYSERSTAIHAKEETAAPSPSTQQLGPNAARDAAAERVTPRKAVSPFDSKPMGAPKAAAGAAAPASPFGAAPAKPASPFGASAAPAASPFGASAAKPASPFGASAAAKPASPFGASASAPAAAPAPPSAGASPFGAPSKPAFPSAGAPAASPFGASAGSTPKPAAAPRMNQAAPKQEKGGFEMPKPTLAQVIITVSFTTITTVMFSTVYLVYSAGAIHFNDR